MKILVLAPRFPFPLERGDKLRLYHQLKYLGKRHEITLVSISESPEDEVNKSKLDAFCKKIILLKLPKWKVLLNLAAGLMAGDSLQTSYFYNKGFQAIIDETIAFEKPDAIYCFLLRMAPYLDLSPLAKTIDFQDAFSAGMQRRAGAERWPISWIFRREAKLLQAYEVKLAERFEGKCIISEQDRNTIPFKQPNEVEIVPNGIDTDFFSSYPATEKKYDLAFVGNMGYHPNIVASKYLVNEILPLLKHENLLLAGARPSQDIKSLASERVTVSGWMEDIRAAYAQSRIMVAPLFTGSGQQNKIMEAAATGVPCITTSLVARSLGMEDSKHLLVANTKEEFAQAIGKLLKDKELYAFLRDNANEFVRQQFSWDAANAHLETIITQAVNHKAETRV